MIELSVNDYHKYSDRGKKAKIQVFAEIVWILWCAARVHNDILTEEMFMQTKRNCSKKATMAMRILAIMLVAVMAMGVAVPATVSAAAGDMTGAPQYINPSITTTIRNIGKNEAEKYILAFSNGNEHRADGPNTVEGYAGSLDSSPPVLLKTLSASGYPQLAKNDRGENVATMQSKYGSNTLEPIFNASSATGTATKTYIADNTPFNYNENTQHYVLNSANNHVYFNEQTNKFQIYEEPLRPYHITTSYGYDTFGAFLPFNSIENTMRISDANGNKLSDVTYGGENGVSWNDEAKHAANLHVTPASGNNIADNWFVMKVEFSFYIPEDGMINGEQMVFEFSGDDDVWVYVDDVLVVDQGGTHKHTDSYVNFATGEVGYQHYNADDTSDDAPWPWTKTTIKKSFEAAAAETGDSSYSAASNFNGNTLADFTVHTLTFFFMERGGEASNCKLDFNLPIVPKGALSVQKTLDGIVTEEAKNKEYTFVLKDENGNVLSNTDFSVIKTDGALADGSTDANGQFKLKANERAVFETIEGGKDYSVLQFTEVKDDTYSIYSKDTDCTINGSDSGSLTSDGFNTGKFEVKYDTKNQTNIIFTNTMKQDKKLTVTKDIGEYISDDQAFSFSAKVEGIADPVTFSLKKGETYTITNIPAGADVKITETVPEGMEAESVLSGSDLTGDEAITVTNVTTQDGVVKFTNTMQLFDVVIEKLIDGSLGNKQKEFEFTATVEFGDYSDDVVKTHTFSLKDSGTKSIEGIPYGAKVSISEDKEDYTATVTCGGTSNEADSYEIAKLTADTAVTFENVKDGAPNTGIFLDSLPYVIMLMLVLAGAAAYVFTRRKRMLED